ncbi:uncharacterized protein LOC129306699 [Prosopis cineraria]|uniref:uncharacterized protein LOC129306699 n=1 Tax=Prosopis cineraria TaxID=364024 RepID=UPI00240ECFBB|nr:uncharacterized protein LOC129306699 [Prosopis cineraria]
MPQVETLVSACAGGGSGDRKIACETLADGHSHQVEEAHLPKNNPDSPPESFWLSRDEELDWWDRNAVYERKESTKGNSSNSTNLNPSLKSRSQRVSLKSKASIIGLPKPQKPSFGDAKNRRNHKPGNTRLFPKRSASVGKSESSVIEPSSPKVSCMGRVRSRRDRNRRLRIRQRSSESGTAKEKLMRSKSRGRKPGFFESFRAIFRPRRQENKVQKADLPPEDSPSSKNRTTLPRNSTASDIDASFAEPTPRNSVTESEPPGLGGMKRFASGRRSGAWGVGEPEIHVRQ